MIENGAVTAGTGAASHPAYGANNDARVGMGVSYEGR